MSTDSTANEAKFTPGTWTQGWSQNGIACVWLDGKTEPERGMGDYDYWIDCGTEANARLIAAAPDQHAALQATQLLLERLGLESSDEYQRNATAIAKALGGAA